MHLPTCMRKREPDGSPLYARLLIDPIDADHAFESRNAIELSVLPCARQLPQVLRFQLGSEYIMGPLSVQRNATPRKQRLGRQQRLQGRMLVVQSMQSCGDAQL